MVSGLQGVLIHWTEDGSQSRRDDTGVAWGNALVVLHILGLMAVSSRRDVSDVAVLPSLRDDVFCGFGPVVTLVPQHQSHASA